MVVVGRVLVADLLAEVGRLADELDAFVGMERAVREMKALLLR